jgi:DNA polymerase IV
MSCHTIKIKLRWSDFTTITRQHTLDSSTDKHSLIYQTALALFEKAWTANRPVRLLGVGATGLCSQINGEVAYRQLQLWEGDPSKNQRLRETIASLRERFGDQAVQLGRGLDQEKRE